jgi:Xaa-Pro aminopeptidase
MERTSAFRNSRIFTWEEDQSPYLILKNLLNINSTINIEISEETRSFVREEISKINNFNIIFDMQTSIINEIRMVKSENEINLMRCINNATKNAIKAVYESGVILKGIKESVIKEEGNYYL